jgi:NADP-dependent 3-hydroxy acid dehydrogenase YdfG
MSKVCITGTTRGIGKTLAEHFKQSGWEVIELNRGDVIIESAIGCDLFINNAYIEGHQIDIFNQLYASVKKMIVMGSVAADYPNPSMPVYSQHKKELKERVLDVANTPSSKNADILLLQLTGESYNDSNLIIRTIEFWLDNPKITVISFVPGVPN